jgi:hypothetical protein
MNIPAAADPDPGVDRREVTAGEARHASRHWWDQDAGPQRDTLVVDAGGSTEIDARRLKRGGARKRNFCSPLRGGFYTAFRLQFPDLR